LNRAQESSTLRSRPLHRKDATVCGTLLEFIGINFDYLVEILEGQRVVFNIEMPNQFMPVVSNFPSLQKLSKLSVHRVDLFERQGNAVLVVAAAFLSIFFRNLAIEEAEATGESCCSKHN
jgi:hypothetical protein